MTENSSVSQNNASQYDEFEMDFPQLPSDDEVVPRRGEETGGNDVAQTQKESTSVAATETKGSTNATTQGNLESSNDIVVTQSQEQPSPSIVIETNGSINEIPQNNSENNDDIIVLDDASPNSNKFNNIASNRPATANSSDKATLKRPPPPAEAVIDLLDDDESDNAVEPSKDAKRQKTINGQEQQQPHAKNKPQHETIDVSQNQKQAEAVASAAMASYYGRYNNARSWMQPGVSAPAPMGYPSQYPPPQPYQPAHYPPPHYANLMSNRSKNLDPSVDTPKFQPYPLGFHPTWSDLIPLVEDVRATPLQKFKAANPGEQRRNFQLSLLNVSEFTITGLPVGFDGPPSSLEGLGRTIRKISKRHGKAVFQRDKEDVAGGKWRIPLGAYQEILSYLINDPLTLVEGIEPKQLQIASLERERQEKGYPEVAAVIKKGVPPGVAEALAPFQRGGVDFVIQKHGRALVADDMGLGKTIQGIASMAVYHKEWPLMVLCPSGARYHWEHEFRHWLGKKSNVNENIPRNSEAREGLLSDSQINVLVSSKCKLFPRSNVRVVIISYGLAPILIQNGTIKPRTFRCAIVDESHMLKNLKTKRTSALLPILRATDRCVLLSGTPALAKPAELWPQLSILSTEKEGWWEDEADFLRKYVKDGGPNRSGELNTMLRGTVMIRRLKNDILKTMQKKLRNKAEVHVLDEKQRKEFKELMAKLREGKGQLGKLARKHFGEEGRNEDAEAEAAAAENESDPNTGKMDADGVNEAKKEEYQAAHDHLNNETRRKFNEGKTRINETLASYGSKLDPEQLDNARLQLEGNLRSELEMDYNRKFKEIEEEYKHLSGDTAKPADDEPDKKKNVLTELYGRTGEAKIPLVADMLKKWLEDPTKGKLCIFAHHISVLDSLENLAGLSNKRDSQKKFIRIDGATNPKQRQEQINSFQTDPSVRVALLGITAAGVAVTLTASSTVWFAELFWTPAIMIQAEDRCHRIGQQAQVKCLYFVAKGTVDDVLWKLIEKKFRDLGEFVEGKEKLKLVVDTIYHGTKELYSKIFPNDDGAGSDASDDEEEFNIAELDDELLHDIDEFGQEEREMLLKAEASEDNDGEPKNDLSLLLPVEEKNIVGQSEDDAIALSDDDDEEDEEADTKKSEVKEGTAKDEEDEPKEDIFSDVKMLESPNPTESQIPNCRRYSLLIGTEKLGVEVALFQKRVVVARIGADRLGRLGTEGKPQVGDILVAISGMRLKLLEDITPVMQCLKKKLEKLPLELTFVEIKGFARRFIDHRIRVKKRKQRRAEAVKAKQLQPASNEPVIDLVDD